MRIHLFSTLLLFPTLILSTSPKSCAGPPATSTSTQSRKIALVIDSSGSNADTDPSNLRITAALSILHSLPPTDLVTTLSFSDTAAILYPLGAPNTAAASNSFNSITAFGGTDIASGVDGAIDEFVNNDTKSHPSPVKDASGIIVFTDGEDNAGPDALIASLARAKSLGIRVSFGFLSPDDSTATQDPDVLAGILATGGAYSTISSAEAQVAFVALVLSHGLVNSDVAGQAETLLLPGLLTAGSVDASVKGGQTFIYDAEKGEKLNFTVSAITEAVDFDVTLTVKGGKQVLNSGSTKVAGEVSLLYNSPADEVLELSVSTSDKAKSLFSVTLSSSVNKTIELCGGGGNNNHSTTPSGGEYGGKPSGTGIAPPPLYPSGGAGGSYATGTGSPGYGGGNGTVNSPKPTSSVVYYTSGVGGVSEIRRAGLGGWVAMIVVGMGVFR